MDTNFESPDWDLNVDADRRESRNQKAILIIYVT